MKVWPLGKLGRLWTADGGDRLAVIDCVRGLAILAVVAFHYLYRWAPPRHEVDFYGFDGVFGWAAFGWAGVQLFFVVSGLVIAMTLGRYAGPIAFFVKRLTRIYPAFVVASVLIFGIELFFDPLDLRITAVQFLLNFLILPQSLGVPPVDGAFWSLAVELKFYAWTALAYGLLRERYWLGLMVLGLMGALIIHLSPAIGFKLMIAPYMPSFLLGIAIWHGAIAHDRRNFLICLVIALVLYVVQAPFISHASGSVLASHAFVLGCSGLMALLLWRKSSLTFRPLAFIGRISYSLYLVHQDLGVSAIHALKKAGLPDLAAIGLATGSLVLLAWALFSLIEQPFDRWLYGAYRRFAAKSEQAPATAQALPGAAGDGLSSLESGVTFTGSGISGRDS